MMLIDAIIMGSSFIITKTNNENNHFIQKYTCNFHCDKSIFDSILKFSNGTVFVCEIIVLSCLYLLLDHPYVNNLLNQDN